MGSQLFCQLISGRISLWASHHLHICLYPKHQVLAWAPFSSSVRHSIHKLPHRCISLKYSPKYAHNKPLINNITTATAQESSSFCKTGSLREMEADTVVNQTDTGVIEAEILVNQTDTGVIEAGILVNQTDTGVIEAGILVNQTDTGVIEAENLVNQTDTEVIEAGILVNQTDTGVIEAGILVNQNDVGVVDGLITNTQAEGVPKNPEQSKEELDAKPVSKKALKRLARAEKHREYKRQKREESLKTIQRDDIGYSLEDLDQSSYYFENGVRKVYPYNYVFASHAKGRWVGRKLQDVLGQEFGYDQPDDLMKSFESGQIHVNGKRAALNHVIRNNDYICHRTHRHENPVTAAPIEIIENNDDILVINKPSSIPCHPCGRYRLNSVPFILGKEMGIVNLRGIYRLDRLTSGVLIFCKTPEKTKALMSQVSNRQVQKEYVCRVVGKFPDGRVEVDQPLQALSNKLRLQVVSRTGKSSQTTFQRISYNGKSSVVRCFPHTGRTHQIRVHLQYLGYPILNDAFYNSDAWGPSRGKNGIYELPYDQVCERMMAEHHGTLWVGGPNPLYEVKLREMELKEQKKELSVGANQLTVNSAPAKPTNLSDVNCINVVSIATSDQLQTGNGQEQILACPETNISSNLGSGSVDETSDSHVSEPTLFQRADSQISSDRLVHENQPQEAAIGSSGTSAEMEPAHHLPGFEMSKPAQHLPGFEMSKWTIDPSCDQCKKLLIDPQEKQLVMFLHAIRYKGPDWEYETALPDWASDDWSREEHFLLGSADCFKSS